MAIKMVCVCLVMLKGSVTYVAQEAWIQNATLRDNILFGKPMNSAVYDKVVDACALRPDMEEFPGKDLSEIGEKVFIFLLFILISLDSSCSALTLLVGQQV